MNNKEKYEGKTVEIFAPNGGRKLDVLNVSQVIDDTCLYGTSELSGIETAYDLSDGVKVNVCEELER